MAIFCCYAKESGLTVKIREVLYLFDEISRRLKYSDQQFVLSKSAILFQEQVFLRRYCFRTPVFLAQKYLFPILEALSIPGNISLIYF